jgi:hypothetical protein
MTTPSTDLAEVIRENCRDKMPGGAETVFHQGTERLYKEFYKSTGRKGPQFDADKAVARFAASLAALP